MILGVLSDNHGRLPPVREANDLFERHGVEGVVHCGDLGGVETLEILAGRPIWFVWGNTDVPDPGWRRWVRGTGARWPDDVPVVIDTGQCRVAVCHGHEPQFRKICASGQFAYVLHGHTHQSADSRLGSTRVINPGALHRAAVKTIAILDTMANQVTFVELDQPPTS